MRNKTRRGFTLLELVVTAALASALATSVFVVLRTSQSAWEVHQADQARLEGAHACLRQIVRSVRQADAVVAVTAPEDNSGGLSLLMPSGETYAWDHARGQLAFGVDTPNSLLAENIESFAVLCFEADGQTPTVDPALAQCVECVIGVKLDRRVGSARVIRCRAWRRPTP